MSTKQKAEFNLFAALGWLVWKLLALIGLPLARRKVEQRRRQQDTGLTARVGHAVRLRSRR